MGKREKKNFNKKAKIKIFGIFLFLLIGIFLIFMLPSMKGVGNAFIINETTEYGFSSNIVYLDIKENLGKVQIINITNIFQNSSLTAQLNITEVLLLQLHSVDDYGFVNTSLGKYSYINQTTTMLNGTVNETIRNYYDSSDVLLCKSNINGSIETLLTCNYILGDKSVLIESFGISGSHLQYDYLPLPSIGQVIVIEGQKIKIKQNGIPLPKNGMAQLKITYKKPISIVGNQPTNSENKYNISVDSVDGSDNGILDPTWWNNSWQNSKIIIMTEQNIMARTYEPVIINLTNLFLATNICEKEIRITDNNDLEIPSQITRNGSIAIANGSKWCEVLFIANATQNAQTNYTAYYNNSLATIPDYSSQVSLNLSTGADFWEVYTGTLKFSGRELPDNSTHLIGDNFDSLRSFQIHDTNLSDFMFVGIDGDPRCSAGVITTFDNGLLRKTIGCSSEINSSYKLKITFYDKTRYLKINFTGWGGTYGLDYRYNDTSGINKYAWNSSSSADNFTNSGEISVTGILSMFKNTGSEIWWTGYNISQDANSVKANFQNLSANNPHWVFCQINLADACINVPFEFFYGVTSDATPSFDTANNSVDTIIYHPLSISFGSEQNVSISVDINISYPTQNLNLSSGNIWLNFTNSTTLNTCYWTNNSWVTNYTFLNCFNTTINLADNDWTIKIWANNSDGNFDTDNVTFRVDSTNTTASLGTNPVNLLNSSISSITFDLKCSDNIAVHTLQLYGNWSGSWVVNQTNITSINNTYWNVSVTGIPEGYHSWGVYCNDTAGNYNWSTNRTFLVDVTFPQIAIVYPTNITYNETVIQLNYTLTESNNNSCWYSIDNGAINSSTQINRLNFTGLSSVHGLNNWTIYCNDTAGNTNNTKTYFTYQSILINQLLPIAGTNTTDLTHTFRCNSSSDAFNINNITIGILNSTGSSVYTNTIDTSGNNLKQANETWSTTLPTYDDYSWNCNSTNNQSKFRTTSNQSLIIFRTNFTLSTLSTSNITIGEEFYPTFRVQRISNNYMKWCNVTVYHPTRAILINNQNATDYGNFVDSDGFVWDTYNTTTTALINQSGNYEVNVTCMDRFNTEYRSAINRTAEYTLSLSPQNYNFSAISQKTEVNTFQIYMYDDSEGLINYSISSTIRQPGNFTFNTSLNYIILNSTDNSSNTYGFVFSLAGNSSVANGSYSGNITFTNVTYGLTYYLNFTYNIFPPAGIPSIYEFNTNNLCTTSTTDNCALKEDNLNSGNTRTKQYTINNTGEYRLNQCDVKIKDESSGVDWGSWVSSDATNFSLQIGEKKNITITYTPTGADPGYGLSEGRAYIKCLDGDLGNNPIETNSSNRPYNRFILLTSTDTGGGGASGGGEEQEIIIKSIARNFTILSLNYQNNIDISLSRGSVSPREKPFLIINQGLDPITINLSCSTEGANGSTREIDICDYVEFENDLLLVSPNENDPMISSFKVYTPNGSEIGDKYYFNIFGKSSEGEILAVSKLSVSARVTFLAGVYKDSSLGKSGKTYPSWLLALIISLAIFTIFMFIFTKGFKMPTLGFLISSISAFLSFFLVLSFI